MAAALRRVPGRAVVAVQNGGRVVTLPWDGLTLGAVAGTLEVPFPAWVAPARGVGGLPEGRPGDADRLLTTDNGS